MSSLMASVGTAVVLISSMTTRAVLIGKNAVGPALDDEPGPSIVRLLP